MPRCYTCLLICAKEDTFITRNNQNRFCFLKQEEKGTCENCRMRYRSEKCFKAHKRSTRCYQRKYCKDCDKVYCIQKHDQHDCKKSFMCNICFNYYDKETEHFCPLQKQKMPKELPRPLAAYDLETLVEKGSSNCNACLVEEQAYLSKSGKLKSELKKDEVKYTYCSTHRNMSSHLSTHSCNFLSVVFEQDFYGTFSSIIMADPKLGLEDDLVLKKNFYKIPAQQYYDPFLHGKALNRKLKLQKNSSQKLTSSVNLFPIKMSENHEFEIGSNRTITDNDLNFLRTLQPMEKFVAYFVNPRFCNQVFLVSKHTRTQINIYSH